MIDAPAEQTVRPQRIVLPWPPSANHHWRNVRGRTLLSREGRRYRALVCALLGGNGPRKPPAGGRIALAMDALPPDRRRRDLDNLQKPVLDALEHGGAYLDDGLIDLLITRRQAPIPDGKIIIELAELPLRRCPLCGRDYPEGQTCFDSFHLN